MDQIKLRWRTKVKEFIASSFVRNTLIVATGTAAAQAIGFLMSPILSRLYLPESYGTLAMYVSISALLTQVSCLGYESAVVLPKNDKAGASLVWLSTVSAICIFAVIGLLILVSGGKLWYLLDIPETDHAFFNYLPLVVLFSAVANCLVFWNNRKLLYSVNSFYRVGVSLLLALLSFAFGMYSWKPGLIVSFIIANVLISILFMVYTWKKTPLRLFAISKVEMKNQGINYQQFPKVFLFLNFFDSLRESLFVFIINSFFSVATLGSYAFALRVVRVPLSLITTSVSQVAFQKISQLKNENGNVLEFIRKVVFILILIAIPILLIFLLWGPELFSFVFGSEWEHAGELTKLISVWLVCNFIGAPISTVPMIYGNTRLAFYLSTGYNVLSTVVFYLCAVLSHDFELTLLLTSIASACYMIFSIWRIVYFVKRNQS